MFQIVGGEAIGDLAELQGVAEAVFGRGRRGPTWFRRKLAREGVEARLCAVARASDGAIAGYALLGRAASLGAAARGAGVGVVAQARGQGLGRRLVAFASERAAAAGCDSVEFLAEPARLDWYLRQGFAPVEEQLTLLGLGRRGALRDRDDAADASPQATSELELGPAPLWAWIPEVWARTPSAERRVHVHARGRAWLTRENRAWLVHRVELADDEPGALLALLEALREGLASTTPLLLYPCPARATWIPTLRAAGFDLAQRATLVRRRA